MENVCFVSSTPLGTLEFKAHYGEGWGVEGLGQWGTEAETYQGGSGSGGRPLCSLGDLFLGFRESQPSPNLASHPPDASETIISAVVGGSSRQEPAACSAW